MQIIIFFFTILFFLLFPYPAHAHLPGQAPFFKVNGVYTDFYPVFSTSVSDFELPQDIAPQAYLVNETIDFEIDTSKLPVPPEIVDQTIFVWDFGDGTKAAGLKNTHSYAKMGSYTLSVFVDTTSFEEGVAPSLLQSTLINIVPSKEYKLPKSVIKVNGKKSSDPITDVFVLRFGEKFTFDGSESTGGASRIVSYFWDFGDEKVSNEKVVEHVYTKDIPMVFPVLRIKDANGFVSDSYVEITNELQQTQKGPLGPRATQGNTDLKRPTQLPYILAGIAIIIALIFLAKRLKRKK